MVFFQRHNRDNAARLNRARRDRKAMSARQKLRSLIARSGTFETLEQRQMLAADPQLLLDINPGVGSSSSRDFVQVGTSTFFVANDGTNGTELWKTDGTEAGTTLVKNIIDGASGSDPRYLTNVGGTLFFSAVDDTNGRELWTSDGTEQGTTLVKDIIDGANGSNPSFLTNVGGTLFFNAYDDTNGRELWTSDGTEQGTTLVKDIIDGASGSDPRNLTNVGGTLFFSADDDTNGRELWKSDGTEVGTTLVKDIGDGAPGSYPYNLTNVGGTLFFSAFGDTNGSELWKSDGTEQGTTLVKDIRDGADGSYPGNLTNVGGTLFFSAVDDTNGSELWKSDGTEVGTTLVKDIRDGANGSYLGNLTNVGGTLFFSAFDDTNGQELWKSDGTEMGTTLVKDIRDGADGSYPGNLTNVGGTLFFSAVDDTNGSELWKSDGTEQGTTLVKDIRDGAGSSLPRYLTNVDGTLFFNADNGVDGREPFTLGLAVVDLGRLETNGGVGPFRAVLDPNDATMIQIVDSTGAVLQTIDKTTTNVLNVNGTNGDDTFTVDFTNGNPAPAVGITFSGGLQATAMGDVLNVIGSFNTQTITMTPPGPDGNNGVLDLDGAIISFLGLEPINAGNSVNTILNLPAGLVNAATLQNRVDTPGSIEIVDNALVSTFEDTIIPNPTGSLVINLGAMGDILNVESLDAGYNVPLTITGGAGADSVNFNSSLNLGAGNLLVNTAAADTTTISADLTSTGTQTFNRAVTLGADVTLAAATVTVPLVEGTAANTEGLAVTGNFVAGGAIGNTTPLEFLTVGGTSAINGGTVTTSGVQTYTGAVTLGANTILSAGTATFSSTIDADAAANNRTLTINSVGVTTLGGAIGATEPLGSVTTDAAGSTSIGAGTITTSAAQTFNDATTLTADLTNNGVVVSYRGTLDGAFNLAVNDSSSSNFTGFQRDVGASVPLASITTDAVGVTAMSDGTADITITTSGDQTYNDEVKTTASGNTVTLVSTGGKIAFNGALNESTGNDDIIVINSLGGPAVFGATIGAAGAFDAVTINTVGPFALNQNITAVNDISVTVIDSTVAGDNFTLSGGATITSNAGSISINVGDDVDIQAGTTINAPGGSLTINVDPIAPVVAPVVADADPGTGSTVIVAGTITTPNTNLNGGDDSDVFTPTPQATTMFNIDGNLPTLPTLPGDVLNYQGTGTVTLTGAGSGIITSPGLMPVNYLSIESVQAVPGPLDLVISANADPGGDNVADDGAADGFRLVRNGDNLEVYINGDLASTETYADVATITVNGSGDDDTLTVDHSGGLINRVINFDGNAITNAADNDTLVHVGDPGAAVIRETYLVGATEDAGTWILDPNDSMGAGATVAPDGDESIVNFTNLEPVDSSVPAAIFDVVYDAGDVDDISVVDGGLLAGFASLQVTDNSATFETFRFANKTTTRLHLNDGPDTATLNYATPAAGLSTLEIFGHGAADVVGLAAEDNASDQFALISTADNAAVGPAFDTSLFGDGGDDRFNNFAAVVPNGTSSLAAINGRIQLDGGAGGDDEIGLSAFSDPAITATLTATQLTGSAPGTFDYVNVEEFTLSGSGAGDDVIDIVGTAAGTSYFVGGEGADDTVTIGNSTADFNANVLDGTLAAIAGRVVVATELGDDTLNVDASSDATLAGVADISNIGSDMFEYGGFNNTGNTTRLTNFAIATIDYRHDATAGGAGTDVNNRLEQFNVRASTGDDVINVNATTAVTTTTIDSLTGDDTVTINGDDLSADNVFFGNDGNDEFILNVAADLGAASFAALTNLSIQGQANDVANRDRLTINDNSGAARGFDYDFQDAGGMNVEDGFAIDIQVRTTETLIFNDAADNDTVSITGTSGDDDLTVALLEDATSVLAFLGGTPYLQAPPEPLVGAPLPGVEGGGSGPDLLINGLVDGSAVNLFGDGNTATAGLGDRGIVYAASEDPLSTGGALDIFGFGPGELVPGFDAGDAWDEIIVDGTTGTVQVTNNDAGLLNAVVIDNASFTQFGPVASSQRAALIVNGGDEAAANVTTGIADEFSVTASVLYNIQVNGNNPGAAGLGPDGFPVGDQLNLTSPDSINVFSDKVTPPNVSTTFGNNIFGIRDSSIERKRLVPGNGVVNLIGDNNDPAPAADQNDNFVIVGRDIDGNGDGVNEGVLNINNSSPILIDGMTDLNVYGFELAGQPMLNLNSPSTNFVDPSATGFDTLDISPYADDTPRGWGVDVFFSEGEPSLDSVQDDLIIYRTSMFGGQVSEDIVIQPSDEQDGEIVVTNLGFGTPIVDIDYVGNMDIIVVDNDGFQNDNDRLTLRGTNPDNPDTSGNENVVANFNNDGSVGNPIVTVSDASGGILYQLRNTHDAVAGSAETFDLIHFDLLAGDDNVSIIGRDDASVSANVIGGLGNDTLTLPGTAGNDAYTIGENSASVQLSTAAAGTSVNFTGIDAIGVNGGGGAGTDTLNVSGNGADNAFALTGTPLAGTVTVDDGPTITTTAMGTGTSIVNLNGAGGQDRVDASLSAAGTDTVTYTPTAANGGTLAMAAAVGNVVLTGVESLDVDALEGAGDPDALTIAMASATISANGPESGVVTSNDAAGNALLPLNYSHFETAGIAAGSGTGVIQGTEGNDTITVAANGNVTVTDEFGNANVFAAAGFTNLVINSLGGDDTINVTPSALIISVIGGDNGTASDTLNFNGAGAAIAHNLATNSLTETGLGAVSYDGVENVNINAGGQALTVTGTAGSDTLLVTPTVAGAGTFTHNATDGVTFNYNTAASTTFAGGTGGADTIEILGDELVDAITATANTVTVDASVITLGAGLEALKVHAFGGDDNVNLTGFTNGGNAMNVEIYGGVGNDTIRGSDLNDVIYGGAGNDILMGGIGSDTQHGEDGRDIFGNPGLASDGVADDPGTDFNFGGAGDDNFVWEPGDGTDFNQGGNDGGDIFRFFGRAAVDTFTLRSGGTPTHLNAVFNAAVIDNHGVEDFIIDPLAGDDIINIDDLFATEVVNVTVVAGGGNETINVAGRGADDTVSITTPGADVVDIEGFDYDISVRGSAPTDTLNFNAGSGNDSIPVGNGVELEINSIINGGGGNDAITGWFTTANGDAGDDTIVGAANNNIINGGAGDDIIDGRGGNNTIDGGADTDTILVSGTAAGETIGVVHTVGTLTVTGGASAGVNAITTMEAVGVEAGDGSDTINITTLAAGGLNYEVLGGNPIGAVGDTLNVTSANALTFMAGPETDSGAFSDDVTGNIVSFDEIEAIGVTLLPIGAITVMGTGDDDEITVIGLAANSVSVQINDGPAIVYAGINTLNVQGKSGDDDITLDLDVANLGVTINVDGGLPTTDRDRVRVTGVDGTDDTPNWTPSASDAGLLQLAGQQPINITNSEELVYDGEGDNETLTVTGTAGVDTFVHQPGSVADAGSVRMNSTLGVAYEDLGTTGSVTIAGAAGNDSLVAHGTNSNDTMSVAATTGAVTLVTTSATHVVLNQTNVENLIVDGLDGDDTFNVPGNHPYTTLSVHGGNPDNGSDVLNFGGAGAAITADLAAHTVTETGFLPVDFVGIETVNIAAANAALNANLTANDDELTYRPTGATAGTFRNENDNTTFNFTSVTGAFTVNALASVGDHLIIEGTNSHDQIAVNSPARTATVTDAAGTALKAVTLANDVEVITALGRAGNDTFTVTPAPTVGGVTNGNLLVNVDGGGPGASDALVIATAAGATLPATDFAVNAVGLNPGEGRVRVFRNAVAMPDIAYTDVEIVSPNVVVAGGVPQMLVLGPDASEPNEFRTNATHLGAGDTINVDNLAIFPNFGEHPGVPADVDFFQIVAESTGVLDVTAHFEMYGALLPGAGNLTLNALDAVGNVIAGAGTFGNADTTPNARVRFPVVQGQTYFVRVTGSAANVVNGYELTVTNEAPATPFDLELLDNPAGGTTNPPGGSVNSDTGRSQFDNVTYDTTPTIFFRLDDGAFLFDIQGNTPPLTNNPTDEVIAIPFQPGPAPAAAGFSIAIFDEGNTTPQVGTAPQTPLGFATAVAGQPGVYTFTVPTALSNGTHFLSARVQITDPAVATQVGFGARSESLEIIVDSVAPPVSFGETTIVDDGLHPDSDSGNANLPGTLSDNITNDLTPTFFGRAEANSIVRLYLDSNSNGNVDAGDLFLGQDVANPLDGTNQHPGGAWQITSTVSMNDPAVIAALGLPATSLDGVRPILIQAEDVAGNLSADAAATRLSIFVDTQGPQVSDVRITGNATFDLFTLKPNNVAQGPTPRVDSITISVQDLPARTTQFLYAAISNVADANAAISVIGDHSGIVPITSVVFNDTTVAGANGTGTITLTFAKSLPDDRFTLAIDDSLIDPVGNALDGETDASRPIGAFNPNSGDNIAGGDFIARFTVDSRPEVGSISQGLVYVDINGNQDFDPEGQDNDAVNRDFVYQFGRISDGLFTGNFSRDNNPSGFDKLGAYGALNSSSSNPQYSFLIDTDDDGVGDVAKTFDIPGVNAIAVAGNFNEADNPGDGDEPVLFDGQNWYVFDIDGTDINLINTIPTTYIGIPMIGDFNGDGNDDFAVYQNDTNVVIFDTDLDGVEDSRFEFGRFPGLSGFTDKPVVGDLNLDGVDDFGIWVKGRDGVLPREAGEYFFWLSDRPRAGFELPGYAGPTSDLVDASNNFNSFSPDTLPGGNDLFTQWGDEFALPILGNFDPVLSDVTPVDVGSSTNKLNSADVNNDGQVTALDALILINALNDGNEGIDLSNSLRAQAVLGQGFYDVDGNETLTAVDALRVINTLNELDSTQNNASSEPVSEVTWQEGVDSFFEVEDDDEDEDEILEDVISLMF